ncbi:MAG: DUF4159 domain-containing protein [Victivallales bacterium]|nr:DUF4159 domain-containing protein [Victivallales bacterium]
MNRWIKIIVPVGMVALITLPARAGENDFLKPVGLPPPATAQRRQGGEAFPPLPLPATPLRRSERKRPPSPTALIGKVVWGSYLDYHWPNGVTSRVFDWNMVPADCQRLLRLFKHFTRMEYRAQTVDLASFSGNPAELPVLFFSGGRTVVLTPPERAKLRRYLLDGGSVWFDSVVGSPYFYRSVKQEIAAILPESPLRRLPPDHPVFRLVRTVTTAELNDGVKAAPILDGAYVGARLAVIVSPYGLGGGWDDVYPTLVPAAQYYRRRSACELGLNLAAYAVGWFETGRAYAVGEAYDAARGSGADRVVFAQIKTLGWWNSDPGAETRFMRYLTRNVNIAIGDKPVYVDPELAQLEDYSFLYLGGVGSFQLTSRGIDALRRYLDGGGCLLINNSLGMNEFDLSCRRLMSRLYPRTTPTMISPENPLFARGPFQFSSSGFSAVAARKYPGMTHPLLYGIKDGDRYKLIYSPVDIAGGWLGTPRPGSVGYDAATANRIGADIITYFLTH